MDDYDLPSETTVWRLMEIANAYARVGQIKKGRRLGPLRSDRPGLIQLVRDFCDVVDESQLPGSIELAEELRQGRLMSGFEKAVEGYPGAVLRDREAEKLRADLDALWVRVRDEASSHRVYVAKPTIWKVPFENFIESPRRAFELAPAYDPELPEAVEEKLDENLNEAARCLSVGFMPAAIFSMLRATEVVLKYFYERVTEDTGLSRDTNRPWGGLCKFLEEDSRTPPRLVKAIRKLKDEYRDQIMHVTEGGPALDEDTALNVLYRCSAVIGHMMQHLGDIGKIRPLTGSPDGLDFTEE